MNRTNKYFLFTVFALLISGLLISCGDGGGDDSSSSTTSGESVTLRGSVADTGSNGSQARNGLTDSIRNVFTFLHTAIAQEQQVFEGIFVEAFEGELLVGEDITDSSGEFVIEGVPCETPLTLVFTFEGNEVILEGVSVPCTDMSGEGVISMVVSLNFSEGEVEVDEIEEEASLMDAAFSCTTDTQEVDANGEEFVLDGEGHACIVTAGNCDLNIRAASVVLMNCSTCIDTRGNSSVDILATQFDCVANGDGIKSVGSSAVDITVIGSEMTDGTVVPTDAQMMKHMGDGTVIGSGNGNMLIIAGEDGADLRGNTRLSMHAFADGTTMSSEIRGDITIDGIANGIIAVGNSGAVLEAETCTVEPNTTTKGNSQVELDCGEVNTSSGNDSPPGNGPPQNGPPE